MKIAPVAVLAVALATPLPLLAQGATPAPKKEPAPAAKPSGGKSGSTQKAGPLGVVSGTGTVATPPPGAREAEFQDVRLLPSKDEDPFEHERLGLAAVQAKDYARARELFQRSWDVGELPTAAYNLACLDALDGKRDSAFKRLEQAVAFGFDDEKTALNDKDLESVRADGRFSAVLAGIRKNRASGDAAVVSEGIVLPPPSAPVGILVLMHDVFSDPLSFSSPFVEEAKRRGLLLVAPRGPAKAGKRRFGWGGGERGFAAVEMAVEAARKKVGSLPIPMFLVGAGRGGTLGFSYAARKGGFAGLASIGGPFDPGQPTSGEAQGDALAAGLRGARLYIGVCRDANPNQVGAVRRGLDSLKRVGHTPVFREWPGASAVFPVDVAGTVKDVLDTIGTAR